MVELIPVIPVIPVIHRLHRPDSAWANRQSVSLTGLSQGAAFRKRRDAPSDGPAESGGSLRTEANRSEGPGQPEGRSARRRRKPKPNPLSFEGPAKPEAPGRKVSRKDAEEAS